MPRQIPNDDAAQLSLFEGVKDVVRATIKETLAEPRRVVDPRRPLEQYPIHMTPAQTAAYLGCSTRHVYNLVDEGKLESVDLGLGSRRDLRITRDSIARLCSESKPSPHDTRSK